MEHISEEEAIEVLHRNSTDEKSFQIVLKHSQAVKEVAIEIAQGINGIDLDFLRSACLLHDIGRFEHPPGKDTIRHGIAGAKILRSIGLEAHARVAERHLGVGITKEDIKIQGLDLPEADYVPETREEKIIAYADNLIFGNKRGTLEEVKARYREEIGEYMVVRIDRLHEQIEQMKAS